MFLQHRRVFLHRLLLAKWSRAETTLYMIYVHAKIQRGCTHFHGKIHYNRRSYIWAILEEFPIGAYHFTICGITNRTFVPAALINDGGEDDKHRSAAPYGDDDCGQHDAYHVDRTWLYLDTVQRQVSLWPTTR